MIKLADYIKTLPHWHKHRQGHIIKITRYEGGVFYGEFYNYASGGVIESSANEEMHMRYIESGELTEIAPEELTKYLLLNEKGSR